LIKKSVTGGIILLFLLSSLIPIVSSDTPTLNKTIYVDDDNTSGPWDGTQEHPYQYIKSAIDNASDGDVINVYSGTYYEVLKLYKQLSLIGIDNGGGKPVVDGRHVSRIYNFEIMHDNCTVDNFVSINSGCILLSGKHCIISNIDLLGVDTPNAYAWNGIRIEGDHKADYSKILNCTIDTDYRYGITLRGSGSEYIEISDNTIINIDFSIYLEGGPRYYDILRNYIHSEQKDMIVQYGVILVGGGGHRIIGNYIHGSDYGIGLQWIREKSEVKMNTISSNKYTGIIIIAHYGGDLIIENNNIMKNGVYGLAVDYSELRGENTLTYVTRNNFIQNNRDAIYTLESKGITWIENYWGRPRIFPKPIQAGLPFPFGSSRLIPLPLWSFDWHPASEPYDIPIPEVS